MAITLKKSVADLVEEARAQIEEIPVSQALEMVDDPSVQIVDIRDVRERQKFGFIPGSFHCPRGFVEFWVDPDSPYYNPLFAEDKKFVLHCASGWRSSLSVLALKNMGFEAAHIKEGFGEWVKQDGPVEFPPKR